MTSRYDKSKLQSRTRAHAIFDILPHERENAWLKGVGGGVRFPHVNADNVDAWLMNAAANAPACGTWTMLYNHTGEAVLYIFRTGEGEDKWIKTDYELAYFPKWRFVKFMMDSPVEVLSDERKAHTDKHSARLICLKADYKAFVRAMLLGQCPIPPIFAQFLDDSM